MAEKLKNNKALGQHWLKDRAILDEIAELSIPDIPPEEEMSTCLEIGPGLGTLTSSLLRIYPRVIAVEFDQRLAENLPKSFPGKNLTVVNADFMNCDLDEMPKGYVVCANIPYYITSPIITKLLTEKNAPAKIVLLIQKEVAERIGAGQEGFSDEEATRIKAKHSVLSLFVQNRARVSLGPVVPREMFTPAPKVDSQVLILEPHEVVVDEEVFKVIERGFASPRKKLYKNLGVKKEVLVGLEISPDARPEDLTLADWGELAGVLRVATKR